MAKLTFRIWLLIIVVLLSLVSIFSIPPMIFEKGVNVQSVTDNSTVFNQGLRAGTRIISINGNTVNNIQDYNTYMNEFVKSADSSLTKEAKLTITTKTNEVIGLFNSNVIGDITVKGISPTKIKTGLDLQGGARALVSADLPAGEKLTEAQLNDLISVSEERLNVYGLSDVRFFKVTTSDGNNLMGVEIAGSSPKDLESLIAQQGKFEAKIGNDTVFTGDNKDITHVGKTGQDAMISDCQTVSASEEYCTFRFTIFISEAAAQRHANLTKNLRVIDGYLEKKIAFYIDGEKTSELNIGADLKGSVSTSFQITGSEKGATRQEAITNAQAEMKKLQAILSTGSLPFKLKIEKLDNLSPNLGDQFTQHIVLGGLLAVVAVSIIIFVRYRKIKASLALVIVSMSEVVIILGIAALIKWNLDLPSIAGIIATIGTGIDSQLIILDESRHNKDDSIKQRIKKALFIIGAAFATSFVSLVPLTGMLGFMGIAAASAGMLKGFAVTTIIGITAGILITRPAFADITRQMEE